jgi:hypothetical protein
MSPSVKGTGGRTVPATPRNGFGSAQIAFTKGGPGVDVRRLLASSPLLPATFPLVTASLTAPL